MSKPFDVTTKELVEADPQSWIRYVGLPDAPTELIDSDLATVSTEADRVLRVKAAFPYLAHLEFQSTYKLDLGHRALRYNVLLFYRHGLPVQSVIILLRREADGPAMTGRVEYVTDPNDGLLTFRYRIVRVWEQSDEDLLAGDLATLPLALLTDAARDHLPQTVRRMEARIQAEATPSEAEFLWTAAYILTGLRYPADIAGELLKGVRAMEDSSTYQAIIAKGEARGRAEGEARGRVEGEARGRVEGEARGRVEGASLGKMEEARNLLLRLGRKRFGEPDAVTLQFVQNLNNLETLERLMERLLEAENWSELLA